MAPPLEPGQTGPSELPRCQVYLARLAQLRPQHRDLLDGRETERALRMRNQAGQDLFVLATALLRVAVGQRVGVDAAGVVLDRSCEHCGSLRHGRPRLPGTGLEASISHSGELVAVALTNDRPVGVDVEIIGAREYESLVPSVCAPAERPGIGSAADFYTYWTRKEAILKATGEGMQIPLSAVVVTEPDCAPELSALGPGSPPPCRMTDIPLAGYKGTVAVLTADAIAFDLIDTRKMLNS